MKMTFGLVHASYSFPKWQAVKLTLFAPFNSFIGPRTNIAACSSKDYPNTGC